MPKEIILKPRVRLSDEELERRARLLLETGEDDGNDEVLDVAVKIAHQEKLPVTFRVEGGEKVFTPELAYSLRYDRGLDIRYPR